MSTHSWTHAHPQDEEQRSGSCKAVKAMLGHARLRNSQYERIRWHIANPSAWQCRCRQLQQSCRSVGDRRQCGYTVCNVHTQSAMCTHSVQCAYTMYLSEHHTTKQHTCYRDKGGGNKQALVKLYIVHKKRPPVRMPACQAVS
eukprot:scaffold76046_cov24-Tisochrysis_lutea.AAC.3